MNLKLNLVLLLSSLIFTSCGKDSEPTHQSHPTSDVLIYKKYVKLNEAKNSVCGDLDITGKLVEYFFKGIRNGEINYDYVTFKSSDYTFNSVLKSTDNLPIFEVFKTGNHTEEHYDSYVNEKNKIIKKKFLGMKYIADAKDLSVCSHIDYSTTFDLEGIALSVAKTIEKTYLKAQPIYKKLTNKTFDKVTIHTQEIIDEVFHYTHKEQDREDHFYIVNNAFYTSSNLTIAFTPTGYGDTNEWQTPFTASHEYGHHIFAQLMSKYTKIRNTRENDSLHLCSTETRSYFQNKNNSFKSKIKPNKIIKAMNEGFADLISFLTLKEDESSLKNSKCGELSRDIHSEKFKNGVAKTLTSKKLETYLKGDAPLTAHCSDFNNNTSHHIGAILSHIIYISMKTYTSDKDEMLEILFTWLNRLNFDFDEDQNITNSKYLHKALNTFFDTLLDRGADHASIKHIVQKHFPDWK